MKRIKERKRKKKEDEKRDGNGGGSDNIVQFKSQVWSVTEHYIARTRKNIILCIVIQLSWKRLRNIF